MSGGNGSMNIQTLYQYNGLRPLTNSNNCNDIEINAHLKNGDVSCGLKKNRHSLYQFNESSYFNEMHWDVENCDVSG